MCVTKQKLKLNSIFKKQINVDQIEKLESEIVIRYVRESVESNAEIKFCCNVATEMEI